MKQTIKFTLERETKGAVRYKEDTDKEAGAYVIGTLYIRKVALPKPYPPAITITLESTNGA